jgi:hypothetical protein
VAQEHMFRISNLTYNKVVVTERITVIITAISNENHSKNWNILRTAKISKKTCQTDIKKHML